MRLEARARLLAISSILYHFTSVSSANQILQQDRFALKPTEANYTEEVLMGKGYYLSCARSPTSSYFSSYPGWCVLELDGQRIASKYKAKPVSYWGPDIGDEMEDRVISTKPFIDKASSYIRAIHCIVPETDKQKKWVLELYKRCRRKKIPLYFGTGKYLTRLSPSMRVNVNPTEWFVKEQDEEKSDWAKQRSTPTHEYRLGVSDLLPYQLLIRLNPGQESGLTGHALKGFEQKKKDIVTYRDDRPFASDLHNAKSDKYGDPLGDRERMEWIVSYMHEHNMNAKDLINFLSEKWK